MRRTIFLALLATLLFVPTARAASSTQIIRDCIDDSVLEGHYSLSELRNARSHLPTDADEYSDCRDVLARAIAAATSSSSSSSSGGGSHGGGGGGGTSPGGGTTSGGSSGSHDSSRSTAPAAPVTPTTPQDQAALNEAATKGNGPVDVGGQAVLPGGASRLAANVGRNQLPTTLVIVLVLVALAALAAGVPRVRNRVLAHRQS